MRLGRLVDMIGGTFCRSGSRFSLLLLYLFGLCGNFWWVGTSVRFWTFLRMSWCGLGMIGGRLWWSICLRGRSR